MMKINRLMTNICSDKLTESKYFYTKLFDFKVNFESDWFIHLTSGNGNLELGLIDKSNDLVPAEFQNHPQGFYLTFVVDNVDTVFKIAKEEKFEILANPTDTAYGQRRLLIKDPNGSMLDVSSPIKDFKF